MHSNGLTICIDETHQASDENRVLIRLANWLIENQFLVKIVMMSATPPVFDPRLTHIASIEPIILEQTSFPIEIRYIETPLITTRICERDDDSEGEVEKISQINIPGILDRVVQEIVAHDDESGTILVFLSGIDDINKVKKSLRRHVLKHPVCIYTASSSNYEKRQAMVPGDKIILVTDAVESGVTIPNVTLVIDSLLKKTPISIDGRDALNTCTSSKASSKQRAGRTGRTCSGKVIRMTTESEFVKLVDHSPLEQLKDLQSWVIDFIGTGVDVCQVLDITCEQLDSIYGDLQQVGFLKNGRLTQRGYSSKKIQFTNHEIKHTMTLILEHYRDNLTKLKLIVAFAYIDSTIATSPFIIPQDIDADEIQDFLQETYGHYCASSDIESGVLMFATMMSEHNRGQYQPRMSFEDVYKSWCETNSLSTRVMKDVFTKVINCCELYNIYFSDKRSNRAFDNREWQDIIQICGDGEITTLLKEKLVQMHPDKVYTRGFDGTTFSNGKVNTSFPKFALNLNHYRYNRIFALSCHSIAVCGQIRKRTIGLVIPLEYNTEDDVSNDSDKEDI